MSLTLNVHPPQQHLFSSNPTCFPQTTESANQTTSPSSGDKYTSYSVDVVDRWLASKSSSNKRGRATSEPEADYENCNALQAQLQDARAFRSLDNHQTNTSEICADEIQTMSLSETTLSAVDVKNNSNIINENDKIYDEDGDYAGSAEEDDVNSGDATSTVGSFVHELEKTDDRSIGSRKEMILKVVIDETEKSSTGDEVFYIDPYVSFSFHCDFYQL